MVTKLAIPYLILTSFFSSTWSLRHQRSVSEHHEDYPHMINDAHVSYESTDGIQYLSGMPLCFVCPGRSPLIAEGRADVVVNQESNGDGFFGPPRTCLNAQTSVNWDFLSEDNEKCRLFQQNFRKACCDDDFDPGALCNTGELYNFAKRECQEDLTETGDDPGMWDEENNPYKDNFGNEPVCDLCISGEPPERWWTIAAVLHVGTGTCKDLYWAGKSKRIPGRMCYPSQNALWKACGCPCEDGAEWDSEVIGGKKSYFCSVKDEHGSCGIRNTGVANEDAKIEYRCDDGMDCIDGYCVRPVPQSCADGKGVPVQGGGGLICRLDSGAPCDEASLNEYRSEGDYFLSNPCGTGLTCKRGVCSRSPSRDRNKDKLPHGGRVRGGT